MADYDAIVIGAGHNGLTAAAILQRAGPADPLPGFQALRRGHGIDSGVFRRLRVRDRRLTAVPHLQEGQRRTRTRRIAIGRPRRDVGFAAGHRRRPRRLLHRPDEVALPSQRRARRRGRQRHGRPDGLESGAGPGARPIRSRATAEVTRRNVCLRHKRIRALGHHRPALRIGQRCARPLPPGPREKRRTAGNVGVSRRQHHLPRARHAGQRGRARVRAGGPRRGCRADEEVSGRNRRSHNTSPGSVHLVWRGTTAAQQGGGDSGRRWPGRRRAPAGRLDAGRSRRDLGGCSRCHDHPLGGSECAAGRRTREVLPDRPPRQLPADAFRPGRHTHVHAALRHAERSRNASGHRHFQHSRGVAAAVGELPARDRARRPNHRPADPVGPRPRARPRR